ncbi:unnamed protein product [Caenorhabditis angaria]|uniref:LIM zinc-binding domain-containing protein n=1 Tax=Caenorhabditis angaria TaxID=860376 RepID=A0A9P1IWN6_9PELO|nr:unnamed protein product [Caenorhabditis angaria]
MMKNSAVNQQIYKVLCKGCNNILTRDEAISGKVIKLNNDLYHINCAKCSSCETTIGIRAAYPSSVGTFLCSECNLMANAPKCHACRKSTFEKCVSAFDVHWHQSCFKCRKCSRPFQRMEYIIHKGFAYDEDCYYQETLNILKDDEPIKE